jgi:hypothetical protein
MSSAPTLWFLSCGPKRILYLLLVVDENGGQGIIHRGKLTCRRQYGHMSVGWIPLHDITIIASKTFKNAHFWKCVFVNLKAIQKKNYERVLKLKVSWTCSNSTSLPISHPWNKARVKPPSVQTSPAHTSSTQWFLSVNVSNRVAQCQISWPTTASKQQDSHA